MHLTGHRPDCLWVRDGGRSICTCWPESQLEREQLKQTTMNDLGSILGRCEIRFQHIENKIDSLGESTVPVSEYRHCVTASYNQFEQLNTKLETIIRCLIDRWPEPKFKPAVRRATKKGKSR